MGALEHSKRFGWENTARGTLDIYDQLLSKQNIAAKRFLA
jgi:D-inositol-3-phosphate glycosyltransferase